MTQVAQISGGRIRLRAGTAKTVSDLRRVMADLLRACGRQSDKAEHLVGELVFLGHRR
jgi:hypothetical protein